MCEERHFLFKDKNSESHLWNKVQLFREEECLVDVTLACGGRLFTAHKIVLSACSEYFKEIFSATNNQYPIVFFRDVSCVVLEALLEFIYCGEVSVSQSDICAFMKTAEELKVRGLSASDTHALLKSCKGKSGKRSREGRLTSYIPPSKRHKNKDGQYKSLEETLSEQETSDPELALQEEDSDIEGLSEGELGISFTDLLTNEAGTSGAHSLSHQSGSGREGASASSRDNHSSDVGIANKHSINVTQNGNQAHYQPHGVYSNMKEEEMEIIKEEPVFSNTDMESETEVTNSRKTVDIRETADAEGVMRISRRPLSMTVVPSSATSSASSVKDKNISSLPNKIGSRKCLQTKFKNYLSLLEVDLTHPLLEADLTTPDDMTGMNDRQDYTNSLTIQQLHENQNLLPEKYQYLDLIEQLKNNTTLGPFLYGTLEDLMDRPSLQSVFRDIVIDYLDKNNYIRNGSSCSIRWQYSLLGKTIYESFPTIMWEKGEITCKKAKAEKKDRKRPVNAWTLMMHKVATVRKERKRIAKKKIAMATQLQSVPAMPPGIPHQMSHPMPSASVPPIPSHLPHM